MNSLNSVLLEGNLVANPEEIRNGVCGFTFESFRYNKVDGDRVYEKEVSRFDVEVSGDLGKRCYDELVKGRGVRVVGRLKQTSEGVRIIAEHVEFKPVFDTGIKSEE
jgi:single-strand DNA-binding protein